MNDLDILYVRKLDFSDNIGIYYLYLIERGSLRIKSWLDSRKKLFHISDSVWETEMRFRCKGFLSLPERHFHNVPQWSEDLDPRVQIVRQWEKKVSNNGGFELVWISELVLFRFNFFSVSWKFVVKLCFKTLGYVYNLGKSSWYKWSISACEFSVFCFPLKKRIDHFFQNFKLWTSTGILVLRWSTTVGYARLQTWMMGRKR